MAFAADYRASGLVLRPEAVIKVIFIGNFTPIGCQRNNSEIFIFMRVNGFTVVPTFLVLGPPLGAIVFCFLTLGIDLLMSGAFNPQVWRGAQKLLSIYVINSYFLGLLPAAAASACYLVGVR